MSFALKTTRKRTPFSDKQQRYLIQLFDKGIEDKKKCDPKVVSKGMRTSTNPSFQADEYLSSSQIASYWSNLKQKRE